MSLGLILHALRSTCVIIMMTNVQRLRVGRARWVLDLVGLVNMAGCRTGKSSRWSGHGNGQGTTDSFMLCHCTTSMVSLTASPYHCGVG